MHHLLLPEHVVEEVVFDVVDGRFQDVGKGVEDVVLSRDLGVSYEVTLQVQRVDFQGCLSCLTVLLTHTAWFLYYRSTCLDFFFLCDFVLTLKTFMP